MILDSYLDNLMIYTENLSYFYIFCAFVSLLAVIFTWRIEPRSDSKLKKEKMAQVRSDHRELEDENDGSHISNSSSTMLDKNPLIQSVEDHLSNEEPIYERQIEEQQLMDILELMKKNEKFSNITIEQLQEQLKLYR